MLSYPSLPKFIAAGRKNKCYNWDQLDSIVSKELEKYEFNKLIELGLFLDTTRKSTTYLSEERYDERKANPTASIWEGGADSKELFCLFWVTSFEKFSLIMDEKSVIETHANQLGSKIDSCLEKVMGDVTKLGSVPRKKGEQLLEISRFNGPYDTLFNKFLFEINPNVIRMIITLKPLVWEDGHLIRIACGYTPQIRKDLKGKTGIVRSH